MGVGPQGAPDVRMAVAESEDVLGLVELDRRDQEPPHAPLPGRVEGALALLRRQALEMAVGVDRAREVGLAHLTRVPFGTWAPGWSRTGLPSSEAARIIPCDSTPISFAGWRFATTTTCLPTRSSGL